MKLYIANCTKQIHVFGYRVPEYPSPRFQTIPEGTQVLISGDLSPEQVEYIIEKNVMYGLIDADNVDRAKPFVGLCYSINKPVSMQKIQKLLVHNQDMLEQRAETNLMETALANNQLMENKLKQTAMEAGRPTPAVWEYETSLSDESKNPTKHDFYSGKGKRAKAIVISRGEDGMSKKGRVA